MQTIKKVILVVICLVVLLTSFVAPISATELPDADIPFTPYEDMIDVLDPYAPMPLIEAQYAFYADNEFRFNNLVYEDVNFLYREYLPYGDDTVVIGFRKDESVIYLLFFDAKSTNIFGFAWNPNTGYCAYQFQSLAPVYRIAYSLKYGYPVSFASATGLTDAGVSVETLPSGAKSYYMSYTFIAGDFHVTMTPNYLNSVGLVKNVEGVAYDPVFGLDFGVGVYPSVSTKGDLVQQEQNDLIEEGNQNTKGIWDSIKELPTKIADSIKGFFISLGDRISGFFENLKNYLLYFQETKPEHVNPFADILTDVKSFFDEQMSDVGDFKNSLTSTLNNVVTYIETGSGVVNTFLSAVPVLSAFITFFVVFCIVRKVIGR